MWNMMCDVMPTISEDSISQRSSQFGDDANFEQLMVSMLDERDKLVDSLKNEQEKTADLEGKVKELEKERDSLNRQLNQNLPQEFASLTKVKNHHVRLAFAVHCVADPGSSAFYRSRDPGWVKNPDPGSGSGMNNPDHVSKGLKSQFFGYNT
jgi:septal ring factor EnvC (AmiA/AmiB activator)